MKLTCSSYVSLQLRNDTTVFKRQGVYVRLPVLSVCLNKTQRFGKWFCISDKVKYSNYENCSVGSTG